MQNETLLKKVSVIVPIFNVEGTLEFAVESIRKQTYKNIEIILVDDGSTDKSGNICDILAENDERIIVIHQTNAGVSEARNTGIAKASGEYLCFVDADDEIEQTMIEKLMDNQIKTGAQLVVGGVKEYFKKLTKSCFEDNKVFEFINESEENLIDLCAKPIMMFMHSKLFLKKVFVDNKLLLKHGLVCGEDHLIIYQYLRYIDKISFINDPLYRYYCFNANGATRFFPLAAQIDIFKAKEAFLRDHCSKDVVDKYCAKNALRNFITRINYLAKRNMPNYDEIKTAYDFYLPYFSAFLDCDNIFLPEDKKWFEQNKDYILQLDAKRLFKYFVNEKKKQKKNKKLANVNEFLNMPFKKKVKFVLKKFIK